VVTADHETGGASIGKFMEKDPVSGKEKEVKDKVQINFIDGQHTAALVPVFAMVKNCFLEYILIIQSIINLQKL
jgi:alkaline phosphatase